MLKRFLMASAAVALAAPIAVASAQTQTQPQGQTQTGQAPIGAAGPAGAPPAEPGTFGQLRQDPYGDPSAVRPGEGAADFQGHTQQPHGQTGQAGQFGQQSQIGQQQQHGQFGQQGQVGVHGQTGQTGQFGQQGQIGQQQQGQFGQQQQYGQTGQAGQFGQHGQMQGQAGLRSPLMDQPLQFIAAVDPGASVVVAPRQNLSRADYIREAAAGDLFEIESSRLALERSQSPQVRQFAQAMIEHHTQTSQALRQIAGQDLNPRLNAAQEAKMRALRQAQGQEFDRLYMSQQVAAHKSAVSLHTGYALGDQAGRTVAPGLGWFGGGMDHHGQGQMQGQTQGHMHGQTGQTHMHGQTGVQGQGHMHGQPGQAQMHGQTGQAGLQAQAGARGQGQGRDGMGLTGQGLMGRGMDDQGRVTQGYTAQDGTQGQGFTVPGGQAERAPGVEAQQGFAQGSAGAHAGVQGQTGQTGQFAQHGQAGPYGPQGQVGVQGQPGQPGQMGVQGQAGQTGQAGQFGPQGQAGLQGQAAGDELRQFAFAAAPLIQSHLEAIWQLSDMPTQVAEARADTLQQYDRQGPLAQRGQTFRGYTVFGGAGAEVDAAGAPIRQNQTDQFGVQGQTGQTGQFGVQGQTGQTGHFGVQGQTGQTGQFGVQGQTGQTGQFGVQGQTGGVDAQGRPLGPTSGAIGAPTPLGPTESNLQGGAAATGDMNAQSPRDFGTGHRVGGADVGSPGTTTGTLGTGVTGQAGPGPVTTPPTTGQGDR